MTLRGPDYEVDDNGCWVWLKGKTWNGYGQVNRLRLDGTVGHELAHRWYFKNAHQEEIPEGMQLDHLCRNRACVNPDHLEIVSDRENKDRAMASRTTCRRGHPLTPENVRKRVGRNTYRCLPCARINEANRKPRRRGET